ncbi:hypothetical protein BX600DRAFT_497041 [Xylariales sp. PMI_506]|nr:hypothetical protein BX600DRAFT_497041 [Xylariales sp. PMI_506]
MADSNRSLSACLRCRKQKLRCTGPSQIPCQRCRVSRAECVFVAPKAARPIASTPEDSDKVHHLEQRLDLVEKELRAEIQALQKTVASLSPETLRNNNPSPSLIHHTAAVRGLPHALRVNSPRVEHSDPQEADIVGRGLVNEAQWLEFYNFFDENCRTVISFWDDEMLPPIHIARQLPLMSTAICLIASRAIRPEKYTFLLREADEIVRDSFSGPTPDMLFVKALILLTAWTGRTRLWGYAASVAAELRLNTAALQLGDNSIEHSEELVDQARTWFSLCVFDLAVNLNRPYVINRMKDYLPFAINLLKSPYGRAVDHRICVYIEGFKIAADVKVQMQNAQLHSSPLPSAVVSLFETSNNRFDRWFYEINNTINPLYQTFSGKQDRNRFLVPYCFLKCYINGFALHGIESTDGGSDSIRLDFLQKALDNALLVLQTQYGSEMFRARFRYAVDYTGTTTYTAISIIVRVVTAAYQHLDHSRVFPTLYQAARMFEEAGFVDVANDIRREQENLAALTNTILSSENYEFTGDDANSNRLFDIPSFLDEATLDNVFPQINLYALE